MKHAKMILFALIAALMFGGCSEQAPNESETQAPSETQETTKTTMQTESIPQKEDVQIQYDARLPFEQAFTFYIGRQSVDWNTYSIAPAGTDDWVRVSFTGQCNQKEHEPWYYNQYQIPYEGEQCTKWRVKAECFPDDPIVAELFPDAEYTCTIWEDVQIVNGDTLLQLKVSEEDGSRYFDAVSLADNVCRDCREAFGLSGDESA